MILSRYFGRQLLTSSLLVLMAFWGIVVLMDFVHELGKIDDTYTILAAWYETLYPAPAHLYQLLPAAVLTGGLLSFGNLAQQSELLAARAAGYSHQTIIFSALKKGAYFAVAMLLLSELLIPYAEDLQEQSRAEARGFQETEFDIWARDGQNFIHAARMGDDAIYYDVSVYEYGKQGNLLNIIKAERMKIENDVILLSDVEVTELGFDEMVTTALEQKQIARSAAVEADTLRAETSRRLRIWELAPYIRFLENSKLRSNVYEMSLWKRVSQPLSIFVMLLIAMPFVFAPVRSPSTGKRLFLGIMIGLSYTIVDNGIGNLFIILDWKPVAGAFSLPAVCAALSFWWLRRHY